MCARFERGWRRQNSSGMPVRLMQHKCAMLNDEDAAARGIADGDACVVYNDRGEHKARAIVTTHVMKGVICLENGWWEQQGGSSSYVTNDAAGPIATEHCCNETLVEIRKEA